MISILMHMKQRKHIQVQGFWVGQQHAEESVGFHRTALWNQGRDVMMIMKAQSWPLVWDRSAVRGNPKLEFAHQPGIQIRQQPIWTSLTDWVSDWWKKEMDQKPLLDVELRCIVCVCICVYVFFFKRFLRDACSSEDLRNVNNVMIRGRRYINCAHIHYNFILLKTRSK